MRKHFFTRAGSGIITKATAFTLATLLMLACRTSKFPSDMSINNAVSPPGTIKISNNLYVDKTEITNLSYLEFIAWTQNIYGVNSNEYASILPDSTVWRKLGASYTSLDTFYLRHPVYRDFPVVGVSYDQAVAFSKWRSDRVMELMLIENGIIPFRSTVQKYGIYPIVSKDSIFTIERYFNGQYCGLKPDPHFLTYPHYSLPDAETYKKIFLFADSLNARNYKSCKKKFCEDQLLTGCNCIENKPDRTDALPYGPDPTMETACAFCKKELITHLKGNVREMTTIKGQFYGCSFIDSCKALNNICRKDTVLVNSYTGFRNVCEYKQWKR